jgi:hypothetical protein
LRDNTGEREYIEDTILPTTRFPSDHVIISATFHMTLQVHDTSIDIVKTQFRRERVLTIAGQIHNNC